MSNTIDNQEEQAFTPEAAKALKTLESLRGRGWDLLTNMTEKELDIIEDTIGVLENGRSDAEKDAASYSSTLIRDAREALQNERTRREQERERTMQEHQERIRHIVAASTWLAKTVGEMEQAEAIGNRIHYVPRTAVEILTAEGARGMSDNELAAVADAEDEQANQCDSSMSEWESCADVLERQGGVRGKHLAKVLRTEAGVAREDARAHRANASTARAELDTRA